MTTYCANCGKAIEKSSEVYVHPGGAVDWTFSGDSRTAYGGYSDCDVPGDHYATPAPERHFTDPELSAEFYRAALDLNNAPLSEKVAAAARYYTVLRFATTPNHDTETP